MARTNTILSLAFLSVLVFAGCWEDPPQRLQIGEVCGGGAECETGMCILVPKLGYAICRQAIGEPCRPGWDGYCPPFAECAMDGAEVYHCEVTIVCNMQEADADDSFRSWDCPDAQPYCLYGKCVPVIPVCGKNASNG